MAYRYQHRRERKPWGPNAKLELAATIAVVIAVIATLVIFLLIYHDFPLRLSGGPA